MTSSPRRLRLLLPALMVALIAAGCSGGTAGNQGTQVSSPSPVPAPSAPRLGVASRGPITVSGTTVQRSGSGLAVQAQITATSADQLVTIGSNYTQSVTLKPPVAVSPGNPATVNSSTAVLPLTGPIDPGSTVSVSLVFRSAGTVNVFGRFSG